MRILCYGAGAVGSLMGGRLALAGHDVSLVARPSQAEAIREREGLVVESPMGTQVARNVRAFTGLVEALEKCGCPDLVLLAVKSYDTEQAAADLAAALPASVPVLSLQNGLGNEEILAAALGSDNTLAGVTTISVSLVSPGHVRQRTEKAGLGLAPVSPGGITKVQGLGRVFGAAGFPVRLVPDYRSLKWSKVLLNMLGNACPAILDLDPASVFADPPLFALERKAFLEACRVMTAADVAVTDLPGFPVRILAFGIRRLPGSLVRQVLQQRVGSARGDKKPSLWLDLEKGRGRSEVTALNGGVAREGAALGVPTPVNGTISRILSGIATGDIPWSEYRGRPSRLLAEIAGAEAMSRP